MDAEAWDARYADVELVWGREANRFVVAELADLSPGRALDLACGEGRNAIWLAARGWRVTAVDFSAVAVGRGRELAASAGVTVDWVVADVVTHRPEPEAFDLVLIAYLQLPAAELALVLSHAVCALAVGGELLVVGHDRTNLTDGVGGPQVPEILHTPEEVVAGLGGLVVRRAERVRRPVQLETGTTDAIDTLVRAQRPPAPGVRSG